MDAAITGYVDIAQIVLYIFWIFFFGLVWYIRRTDRREGYPVEYEAREAYGSTGFFWMAKPKEYVLPHGHGSYFAPNDKRDDRPIAAEPVAKTPGAPLEPTGDPMVDGVGPASYVDRDERPELTREGDLLIVPMRVATDYEIFKPSKDVRGFDVLANDKKKVGTVKDIWVDRADQMVRYLEVELEGGAGSRLIPMFSAVVREDCVTVASLKSEHFPKIPTLSNPDQVGVREEDQIMAFYAGGRMYATTYGYGPLV